MVTMVSSKVFRGVDIDGDTVVTFYCPACNFMHPVKITGVNKRTFNNSGTSPGFTGGTLSWNPPDYPFVCIITLSNGTVTYDPACTHSMAGQSIAVPRRFAILGLP